MADTYGSPTPGASDPPQDAIPIDYSGGDQPLTGRVRGVYISTTGHLKVDMAGRNGVTTGATVTFSSLTAGIEHAMQITKIYQSGSTAAGLVLY